MIITSLEAQTGDIFQDINQIIDFGKKSLNIEEYNKYMQLYIDIINKKLEEIDERPIDTKTRLLKDYLNIAKDYFNSDFDMAPMQQFLEDSKEQLKDDFYSFCLEIFEIFQDLPKFPSLFKLISITSINPDYKAVEKKILELITEYKVTYSNEDLFIEDFMRDPVSFNPSPIVAMTTNIIKFLQKLNDNFFKNLKTIEIEAMLHNYASYVEYIRFYFFLILYRIEFSRENRPINFNRQQITEDSIKDRKLKFYPLFYKIFPKEIRDAFNRNVDIGFRIAISHNRVEPVGYKIKAKYQNPNTKEWQYIEYNRENLFLKFINLLSFVSFFELIWNDYKNSYLLKKYPSPYITTSGEFDFKKFIAYEKEKLNKK